MSLFSQLKDIFAQFDRNLGSGAIEWKISDGAHPEDDLISDILKGELENRDFSPAQGERIDELEMYKDALADVLKGSKFKRLTVKTSTHDYTEGVNMLASAIFDQVGLATYGVLGEAKIMSSLSYGNNQVNLDSNAKELVNFPELSKSVVALEKKFQEGWRSNNAASTVTLSDNSTYQIPGEKDLFVKVIEIPPFDLKKDEIPFPFTMLDTMHGLANAKKLHPGEKLDAYVLAGGKIYKNPAKTPTDKPSALVISVKGKDLAAQLLVDDLGVDSKQLGVPDTRYRS
jgi:hypothetical protein